MMEIHNPVQLTMRSFSVLFLLAAGLGLVGSSIVQRAKADAWDKMTYVTIHEKVIAGNQVLEPGAYVWKLMDSQSDRHIVQIFNKEQNHLYETILAIPDYRLRPTGHTSFAFWETPPGVPKAVRAWFYPGDNFGEEFVYPKRLVAQLASAVPAPIPMSYREPAPEPAAVPAPPPAPAVAARAPMPEPQPAAAEPVPASALESAPQAVNSAPQPLPKTASNTPLIGLLGLISLSMAGVLSATAKRS